MKKAKRLFAIRMQRAQNRLDYYRRLVKEVRESRKYDSVSGCTHEWRPEGQTLSGSIDVCIKCRELRFP